MSGAVKTIKKYVVNPIRNILDPGRAMREAQASAPTVEDVIETPDADIAKGAAETAQEEVKRRSKKKKETTQTVLTSPLGATTTAKTAITKLGGS